MAQSYRYPTAAASREHAGFSPSELTGAEKAAVRPGGIAWPQLRVGRRADIDSSNSAMWNDYINEFAVRNSHRGTIRPIGAIACNMVLDTEMRAMIGAKFPNAMRDIRAARDIYREIARGINQHIGRERNAHDFYVRNIVYRERPDLMGVTEGAEHPDPQGNRWVDGFFDLRRTAATAFSGYDGSKIALDLSANDELFEERRSIVRYLQVEEKLEARRFVRADWEPHATVYQANAKLQTTNAMPIIPEEFPLDIALQAPKAHLSNARA